MHRLQDPGRDSRTPDGRLTRPASQPAGPGPTPVPAYRGRFAPSPTGPLHFGSLVSAAAGFLDARAHQGRWLLRIEDLDHYRARPGLDDRIQHDLEAFGLYWDEAVVRQSQRLEAYQAALDQLQQAGLTYACSCNRRELARLCTPGPAGPVYPGTCRGGPRPGRAARAIRLRVPAQVLTFRDRAQGEIRQHLERDCGDFVLFRADGVHAYQLAVVVDDAWQGITHVVRGTDLLANTPRQIYLQRCLGLPTPTYLHHPVVTNARGQKLSKQTGARPLDPRRAPQLIAEALTFLGLAPPAALHGAAPAELWAWAIPAWRRRLARAGKIPP